MLFYKLVLFLLLVCYSGATDNRNDSICGKCRCHGNRIDCDNLFMSTENLVSMLHKSSLSLTTSLPKNITSLSFSNNALTKFPAEKFPRMTEVRYLNISRNLLHRVPNLNRVFPRLTTLDVSSNRVSANSGVFPYSKTEFRYLHHLKDLYLKNNYITSVDHSVFKDLRGIASLDLSNNLIKELSPGFFKYFTNKDCSVNLDFNPLQKLTASLFEPFQTFRILSFRGCHLSTIESGAFLNITVRGLVALDLNKFTALPGSALLELGVDGNATTKISILGNPLYCGCEMYAMFRSLKKTGISLIAGQCQPPSILSGENVDSGSVDSHADVICPSCSVIAGRGLCKKKNETGNCSQCQCNPISQKETRFGFCRFIDNDDVRIRSCNCTATDSLVTASVASGITDRSNNGETANITKSSDSHKWVVIGILGFVIVLILVMLTVTPTHPYCRHRLHKRHLLSVRQRLISSKSQNPNNENDVTMAEFDVTMDDVIVGEETVAGCSKSNDGNDNVFR